eukprot:g476.t1
MIVRDLDTGRVISLESGQNAPPRAISPSALLRRSQRKPPIPPQRKKRGSSDRFGYAASIFRKYASNIGTSFGTLLRKSSGSAESTKIDSTSDTARAIIPRVTVLRNRMANQRTRQGRLEVIQAFEKELQEILLPDRKAVTLDQVEKDLSREPAIIINGVSVKMGEAHVDDEVSVKNCMTRLRERLRSVSETLVEERSGIDFSADQDALLEWIMQAACRTCSGGDSYFTLCSIFNKDVDSLDYLVTPSHAVANKPTVVTVTDHGVSVETFNCYDVQYMAQGTMLAATPRRSKSIVFETSVVEDLNIALFFGSDPNGRLRPGERHLRISLITPGKRKNNVHDMDDSVNNGSHESVQIGLSPAAQNAARRSASPKRRELNNYNSTSSNKTSFQVGDLVQVLVKRGPIAGQMLDAEITMIRDGGLHFDIRTVDYQGHLSAYAHNDIPNVPANRLKKKKKEEEYSPSRRLNFDEEEEEEMLTPIKINRTVMNNSTVNISRTQIPKNRYSLARRVRAIYRLYQPERLEDPDFVAELLRQYPPGYEHFLMQQLRQKYGPEPGEMEENANRLTTPTKQNSSVDDWQACWDEDQAAYYWYSPSRKKSVWAEEENENENANGQSQVASEECWSAYWL